MDTEVLSAEAGQLLLTRRQQKQDEDLGPAECREVPCTHRPPGLSPGDSGQEEWPQEGAGLGGAASPQQPRRCPSSCRCLSITHSAPSWPALPGERRPGQAQEPEVSRCPALTQSRPPSSRSPAPSAPPWELRPCTRTPLSPPALGPGLLFHPQTKGSLLQGGL